MYENPLMIWPNIYKLAMKLTMKLPYTESIHWYTSLVDLVDFLNFYQGNKFWEIFIDKLY